MSTDGVTKRVTSRVSIVAGLLLACALSVSLVAAHRAVAAPAGVPMPTAAEAADPAYMANFYRTYLDVATPALGSTADIASCTPGTTNPASRDAAVTRINALRAIAGVAPTVTENAAWSADAQSTATMMAANNSITHSPPSNWACYSAANATTASRSNLAKGIGGPDAMSAYVSDPGQIGNEVGHRAGLLWPALTSVGIGDAVSAKGTPYDVVKFLVAPNTTNSARRVRDPNGIVSWPACNSAFPYQLIPTGTPWSISKPGLATNSATVSVTKNGQPIGSSWGTHRDDTVMPEQQSTFMVDSGDVRPSPGTADTYAYTISGASVSGTPTTLDCSFRVIDPSDPRAASVATNDIPPAYGAASSVDHFAHTWGVNPAGDPEEFWIDGGQVWHSYRNGSTWSADSPLGGPAGGIRSIEVGFELNYLGHAELYVIGTDGNVYHDYATPGLGSGWSGWGTMGRPGGVQIAGEVGVGRNFVGNQELYLLGSDGAVYHSYSTPGQGTGWSAWSPLGAPAVGIVGDVHVNRNDQDNQEIFVLGRDGLIYHSYSTPGQGSGWSAWSPLGGVGVSTGDLAVWRTRSNNQQLFIVGSDNVVWADTATPGVGSGWSGWKPVGAPAGVRLASFLGLDDAKIVGQMTLWVRDTGGTYWSSQSTTTGSWTAWSAATA